MVHDHIQFSSFLILMGWKLYFHLIFEQYCLDIDGLYTVFMKIVHVMQKNYKNRKCQIQGDAQVLIPNIFTSMKKKLNKDLFTSI